MTPFVTPFLTTAPDRSVRRRPERNRIAMLTPTRRLAALAVVLLIPTLGACGFGYQTDQVYQPALGVNERSGKVDVLAAVVVSSSEGRGTFVASLVNQDLDESDTLSSVTGEGVEVQLSAPIELKPESLLNLADSGAVSVTGDSVSPGRFVRLTLTFESGQKTEVNAPVVPSEDEYNDIEPARPSSPATP